MKSYDVFMCQRSDLEAAKSFCELEDIKSVEITAESQEAATEEALRLLGGQGYEVLKCEERQIVAGFQNFVVTE